MPQFAVGHQAEDIGALSVIHPWAWILFSGTLKSSNTSSGLPISSRKNGCIGSTVLVTSHSGHGATKKGEPYPPWMNKIVMVALLLFLTNSYFLMCYPSPWRTYKPVFLPGPQFCPDTGRTVCTTVEYYPADQIYHLLTISRSQGFNLTSLFVDERKGDIEPNLTQLPTPQPYYQNGYGNNQQPPPGGRFSPAGYNNWNTPTSNKPPDYPGLQPDRWRQVDQPPGGTQSPGTVSRNAYVNTSARQSRTQDLSNQRGTFNSGRMPQTQLQKFNYNDRRTVNNQGNEESFVNNGYNGVTQFNRMDPNLRNGPFENPPHFDNRSFTRYFTPNSQSPQEPFQIQPPAVYQRIKGRNAQSGMTTKPAMNGNWKGAPNYSDYSNSAASEQSRFIGRRDRRNEDVEVACEVRSTYVPPRAALSDNSEWKYVVNVPERDSRFTQVVRVDICLNAGQPCSSRLSLPFGFESRCRQKYIKKKLLSLNSDGQGTSEDNFFIPSCCVCEITRNTEKK